MLLSLRSIPAKIGTHLCHGNSSPLRSKQNLGNRFISPYGNFQYNRYAPKPQYSYQQLYPPSNKPPQIITHPMPNPKNKVD